MIIIDLEMNQPSNKIIDIGAYLVDLKRKSFLSKFDSLCNPGELPSDYILQNGLTITQLTGITPEMVASAEASNVVHDRFWRWVEECKVGGVIGAWGGDIQVIKRESTELGVTVIPKIQDYDLKKLTSFFRAARGGKTKGGLSNSMDLFSVKKHGPAHRALIDAENTSLLMFELFSKLQKMFQIEDILKES